MNTILENQYKKILNKNDHLDSIMKMLGFDDSYFNYFPKNYLEENGIFDKNKKLDKVATMLRAKKSEVETIFKLVPFKKTDKILDYGPGIGLLGILSSPIVKQVDLYEPIDFMKKTFIEIIESYDNVKFIDNITEKYQKIFCRAVIGEFESLQKTDDIKGLFIQFSKSLGPKGMLIFNFHKLDGHVPHHSIQPYDLNLIKTLILEAGFTNFFHSKNSHKAECIAIK